MKEFFISVLMAFSSFFGIHKEKPNISNIEITPTITETIIQEEIFVTPTESSPSPTRKTTHTSSPKPTDLITEEVLKVFFNISNSHEINQILSNKDKISEYEKYYYQKHKQLPIPRLSVIAGKVYSLPGKNGVVVCKSNQLKDLYVELTNIEADITYKNMDIDCHSSDSINYSGRKYKAESKECQDWRRDHDQNRKVPTQFNGSIDQEIAMLIKELASKTNNDHWDSLLEKYCK